MSSKSIWIMHKHDMIMKSGIFVSYWPHPEKPTTFLPFGMLDSHYSLSKYDKQ